MIFLAVGVRSVRKRFIMIATMGSMIAIPVPMKKVDSVNADRPRLGAFDVSELVQVPFSGAGRADQHDQLRQGFLALEDRMGTKKYAFRMFQSWLGTVVVDAIKVFNGTTAYGTSAIRALAKGPIACLRHGTGFCEHDPAPPPRPVPIDDDLGTNLRPHHHTIST